LIRELAGLALRLQHLTKAEVFAVLARFYEELNWDWADDMLPLAQGEKEIWGFLKKDYYAYLEEKAKGREVSILENVSLDIPFVVSLHDCIGVGGLDLIRWQNTANGLCRCGEKMAKSCLYPGSITSYISSVVAVVVSALCLALMRER